MTGLWWYAGSAFWKASERRILPFLDLLLSKGISMTIVRILLVCLFALIIFAPGERNEPEERTPPDEWFVTQRIAHGGVPPGALERAGRAADLMERQFRSAGLSAAWSFVGPVNVGGRINDVAIDPKSPNTVYAGAASGGVWVSRDAGITFSPAWPSSNSQPIGALAITQQGTLFAGTGEANPGGGSLTYGGSGIYRSTNMGKSWKAVGLSGTATISRIVVDPKNSNRIIVAAAGSHFNPGGDRGVYISEDGGSTFTLSLRGINETTGAADLAIDHRNPNRMFAVMWDHLRQPDLRTYGGLGGGVYFTSNGGSSWKRVGAGLPAPSPNIGRIGLAISQSDPRRAYAIVVATNGTFAGFYRSSNGGSSWSKAPFNQALSDSQATFGWWFGRIWIDPLDPNHVFVAGTTLIESRNGGASWVHQLQVHADQHAMAWDPKAPGRIYLGNDGGVYRSDTNGSFTWQWSTRQPFTQFYSVDVAETDSSRIVGGTQDNGSIRIFQGTWVFYFGGDGQRNLINYRDSSKVYACYQYGACAAFSDGGGSRTFIFQGMSSTRFNWSAPLEFDPNDPTILYFGGNRLERSANEARQWTPISQDLTGGPGRDKSYPFGTLTAIGVGKSNSNALYVGTDDGRIWYTRNLGSNWTRSQDPDIPGHWVTRIAVDPANTDTAYATFSGFRSGANNAYVLRTTNGGQSWASITSNLPPAPVNDVVIAPRTLFVATDVGVYSTKNFGASWQLAGSGLPRAPVTDIRYHTPTNSLFAATYGRGIYKLMPAP
jgi:photosystem II stability/assembly factor-like uncharacterized protein